ADGLFFGLPARRLHIEGVATRVLGTRGWNNDFVFDDGVAGTVDVHIEPGTEVMLMDLPHDPRHDLVAVAARPARFACDGIDDARRLDLELDAAPLVEIT